MAHEHKKVYQQSYEYAEKHGEAELYRESDWLNHKCLKAIDAAVSASNYDVNYYDLESAAKFVLGVYGAERLNMILASVICNGELDGRYSDSNKSWARGVQLPDRAEFYPQSHPYVLNGFIDYAREAQKESVLDRLGKSGKAAKQPKREQDKAKDTPKKHKEGGTI